jgi:hypothetical protein
MSVSFPPSPQSESVSLVPTRTSSPAVPSIEHWADVVIVAVSFAVFESPAAVALEAMVNVPGASISYSSIRGSDWPAPSEKVHPSVWRDDVTRVNRPRSRAGS